MTIQKVFLFYHLRLGLKYSVGLVPINLRLKSPETDSCLPSWLVRIKSLLKLQDNNVVSINPSFKLQNMKKTPVGKQVRKYKTLCPPYDIL